jgi:hypothetical protein
MPLRSPADKHKRSPATIDRASEIKIKWLLIGLKAERNFTKDHASSGAYTFLGYFVRMNKICSND